MIEPGAAAGRAILAEAVAGYREALGERLLAAYALGSLAHGGFSPLVSDVDLGLVIADPVSPSDFETGGAPATRLVAAGLAWRDEPPEPADAVALLEAEMVVLYLYYLDDHIGRLGAVGREDLAAAFEEWRRRLVG